jgi:glycine/D-amino acid oxidase-like deaminating enzyme
MLAPKGTRKGDAALTFTFEGRPFLAREGETVAAALIAQGELIHSFAKDGAPRGPYCGMGLCHDCIVTIDGRIGMRGCLTKVKPGMAVQRQAVSATSLSGFVDLAAVPDRSIPEEAVDLLVVGAGPGGLAAAQVAAGSGASVLVVDERPAPGGQYFKQSAVAGRATDRQARDGAGLIRAVRDLGVEIHGETLAWGAFREDDKLVIGLISHGRASYVAPKMLIVATGAFERPGIFPGWTLPGVMTTGACQTLLRSYGIGPGRKVLVAGNGPLNLQVACELLRVGTAVAAVVEAASPPWTQPTKALKLLAADPRLAATGLRQLAILRQHGVPVHWRHRLIRVEGAERAERAVIADAQGGERSFAVDAVCVGEGFAPANELARLVGCAHTIPQGAMHAEVVRDDKGATSLADVFVVGEAGGFGGAHIAMEQGRLAAAEALRRIGRPASRATEARTLRRLTRGSRFQGALWSAFAAPGAGLSRADDDTIVCRCEALRLGTLRRTVEAQNVRDLATLKRLTRAGMGRCQGRYCALALAELVGLPTQESDLLAPQMPLRPVPLAALCVEKPEWGGHRRALLPPQPSRAAAEPLPIEEAAVVVIGAGIAGISTALFLARAGVDVVVLDRGRPNAQASGGNAGSLHAQLLSFDHGAKAEAGGSPAAKTLPLQRDSIALWQQLERELAADFEIKITGGLMVAEAASDLAFLVEKTKAERAQGIACDIVGAAELRALEPALEAGFIGAAFCPQEGKINPLLATQGLLSAALRAGARVLPLANVMAIERAGDGFVIVTDRGRVRAGRVVNAAGAFASEIGRMLSLDIPVFGAPLQMIVTEAVEPLVTRLIAHADRHLTLKQAANGNFLIGGGWTAGLDPVHRRPRPMRASLEGNLWIAQHVVPALRKLHVIRSWAAMNINIDGAPILGEHPAMPGFFNAVTSNGYTLGPLVGQITADLIVRGHADRDIEPFSVGRFERRR